MKKILIGFLTALFGCSVLFSSLAFSAPPPRSNWQNPVACLDQQKRPVDWWVIFKLPKNSNPVTTGTSYLYIDANNPVNLYDTSSLLNQPNQALGYTIDQWYANTENDSIAWAIYNDAPTAIHNRLPSGFQQFGHTKGILAFDKKSGFWLVHSIPDFPAPVKKASAQYEYPSNAKVYGQSLLCVTLPTSQFEEIGKQLEYSNPDVYDSNIPSDYASLVPDLVKAINHTDIITTPAFHRADLYSYYNHTAFISVVQSSPDGDASNADFYQYVANQVVHQNLIVDSWLNGSGGVEGSKCQDPAQVTDIEKLSTEGIAGQYHWDSAQDHSKWAISIPGSDVVCLGDLNRMESQRKRGGGTVCFSNARLHVALQQMVNGHYTKCRT